MSSTTTTVQASSTSTLLLSPAKRRRLAYGSQPPTTPSNHTAVKQPLPSQTQLFSWIFSQDAVAQCFIKDVYDMRPDRDQEFFWLGRVPCRIVCIVGLVVGVQQREFDTRYTVDDGTAVIDCICRYVRPQATSKKCTASHDKKKKGKEKEEPARDCDSSPLPLASVGSSIRVQGRVAAMYESRCLKVKHCQISLCSSTNEEPQHWMTVLDLHQSCYDQTGPFVIPPKSQQHPQLKLTAASTTSTPSRCSDTPSSFTIAATPSVAASSPAKASQDGSLLLQCQVKSPLRLRHPSRLHTQDLTDNTFRIYVKHYMDNAPPYRMLFPAGGSKTPMSSRWSTIPLDESGIPDVFTVGLQKTPRTFRLLSSPMLASSFHDEATPRPTSKHLKRYATTYRHVDDEADFDIGCSEHGCTLGYLRRVPELAEMARRVVLAERKRRVKDARYKGRLKVNQEAVPTGSTSSKPRSSASQYSGCHLHSESSSSEDTSKKMKRLFLKTIRDLHLEGNIILWDGPVRVWTPDSVNEEHNDSRLWKLSSTAGLDSSARTDPSVASPSLSSVNDAGTSDNAGDISDTDPNEEAYVSVTTSRVAPLVKDAIASLTSRTQTFAVPNSNTPQRTSTTTCRSKRPPTAPDILSYIQTSDSHWSNLGQWAVNEALEALRVDGWVYKAGDGRWALSL